MKVAGKVITVTGGGNGIGQQVVLQLLRRGARVAAVDIRQESLEETALLRCRRRVGHIRRRHHRPVGHRCAT